MQQPFNTTDTAGLKQITPEVTWAQRSSKTEAAKNHIYLTISVPDVTPQNIKIDVQPTFIDFSGYSETRKATYKVKLDLYDEIDPAESKVHHTPRDIELVLRKKTLQEEYWPRLLKDKAKVHFLKTNFDKWVDEDEQNEAPEEDDYMSRMGGMGGGMDMEGLGGMGGMGGMPGMGGMGGMPGMGGMGGMGGGFEGIDFSKLGQQGGDEDEDEDEDDEDMPGLEGSGKEEGEMTGTAASVTPTSSEHASAPASTSKIQEVD